MLCEGAVPFESHGNWEEEPVWFFREDFRGNFDDYCRKNDYRFTTAERASPYFIIKHTAELFPDAKTDLYKRVPDERWTGGDLRARGDGRAKALMIPPLKACRAAFEARIMQKVPWDRFGSKIERWEG